MVRKDLATKKTSNRFWLFMRFLYCLMINFFKTFIPISYWPHKDVTDKVVLITGAGSGLGQLMALNFLKLGSKVVGWDINQNGLEQTKELAREQKLKVNNLHLYQINLCERQSIYQMSERVKKEVGTVDILINNAGVVSGSNFLDIPDEKILLTFNVNTLAHFFTIKAFLPDMIAQNHGHIVTVASIAGELGACSLTDYCASKFANVGLDSSLRFELAQADLADSIKTTVVKPYFISTGMFGGIKTGFLPYLKPEYVANRIVEGILTEQIDLVIPAWLSWFSKIWQLFPACSHNYVNEFYGGYEFMTHFHGRPTPTTEEINNNCAKVMNNNNNR